MTRTPEQNLVITGELAIYLSTCITFGPSGGCYQYFLLWRLQALFSAYPFQVSWIFNLSSVLTLTPLEQLFG